MQVPEGIDWAAVSKNAMDKFNVEIAGGLGPTAGKIWCVACMLLRDCVAGVAQAVGGGLAVHVCIDSAVCW